MPAVVHRTKRREHTRQRIQELLKARAAAGAQLSSERELAREIGVCRVTVRRVLADLEREGCLERRHGAGTFVADRGTGRGRARTARLALVAARDYRTMPGWDLRKEMLAGLADGSRRAGAELAEIRLDHPEEAARLESASELRRYDGFISLGVDDPDLLASLAALDRGPVVLLDGYVRGLPLTMVVDAGLEGMREVTRHLLALGHRRIAFIDCFNRAVNNPEKFAGYRAALLERGLAVDEALVAVPASEDGLYDAEPFGAYAVDEFVSAAVRRLLALPEPPTAIIGFDDGRALPAVREAERLGRGVGRDFSVAGFGDQAVRRGWSDRLTSSRIYPRQMAREAVRAALGGERPREARTVFVPTRLFIRSSTCPPNTPPEEETSHV
ncbi:MAG TPA: GntR family transcriptional regulator [Planctomycetota bacterium]|nr:GntR family transcriptional regulator [Planctomycetota bacterium]